jgi:hypothetical protein
MPEPVPDSIVIPDDEPTSSAPPAEVADALTTAQEDRERLLALIEEARTRIAAWEADLEVVDQRIAALDEE